MSAVANRRDAIDADTACSMVCTCAIAASGSAWRITRRTVGAIAAGSPLVRTTSHISDGT